MYKKIDEKIIKELICIVGEKNLIADRDKMADYSHDELALKEIRKLPEVVIKPKNEKEVSEVMKLCSKETIPLTPRGAGTGLCGGCVPVYGGIVMSFDNMNRITDIDQDNLMVTLEAGVNLVDLYEAIEKKGLFFPPHPGDESATVGGLIATNAGGARAVKYGVVRDFVKGIEVVLPDGEIVNIGGKFMKNSSGYSLLHLLVGSEGTLGIITKAVLNLLIPPQVMYTLVVPYNNLTDAIRTVPLLIQNKILPVAVEFMEQEPVRVSEDLLQKKWPCQEGSAYLMIIVDATSEEEIMESLETIGQICLDNNAIDVFVADNKQKQENVLNIRSQMYEALKNYMLEILDVTVPRAEIAAFVTDVHRVEEEFRTWLPTYGHAADGNVHTHIMKYKYEKGNWTEIEDWQEKYPLIRRKIHLLGKKYHGIVSGEHGIGLVKKEYLNLFVQERQIEMMRQIKKLFDPHNILNPGKIFDL